MNLSEKLISTKVRSTNLNKIININYYKIINNNKD